MPAFQFYPADWRKDPGVQSLSWADRGVWIEIICLMHESPRRGVLLMPSGAPMTSTSLARIIGLPLKQTNSCVERLIASGVASREEESGALVNRRMVRDEEARKRQGQAGKTGGSPALCENYNEPGFVYAIQRPQGAIKIGIAKNPTNRLYKLRYLLKEEGLEMLACLPVEDMGREEKTLHEKYQKWCVGGEWFEMPEELKGELISTLKGNAKGKQRASSSSSSSSSKQGEPPKPPDPILQLGEFGRAWMTEEQHAKLKSKLNGHSEDFIRQFDEWVQQAPDAKHNGVKRKDRDPYASILAWYDRAVKRGEIRKKDGDIHV